MDQVKFVENSLYKVWSDMVWLDHITSNFLKAVFHKFNLIDSWIPWPISGAGYILSSTITVYKFKCSCYIFSRILSFCVFKCFHDQKLNRGRSEDLLVTNVTPFYHSKMPENRLSPHTADMRLEICQISMTEFSTKI